jgi:26S proteasome regulatory subunit N12
MSSSSLKKTHADLLKAYSSGSSSVKTQLTKAKIELTQSGLLVPTPSDAASRPQETAMARDVLEVGALWSLQQRDVTGFDRYVGLLRVFYHDCGNALPASKNEEALLGLSLLRLLSSNSISQFHTTLETLPSSLVASSPYIQHPVNLERWLMEGSYSKVWRARKEVPREEYGFFVDELMGTIRREIASCEEKAYDSLPLSDAATLLFFNNMQEVSAFANERGWQINPTTQTVHFTNKAEQAAKGAIPKRATITSNLQFAKELESIV